MELIASLRRASPAVLALGALGAAAPGAAAQTGAGLHDLRAATVTRTDTALVATVPYDPACLDGCVVRLLVAQEGGEVVTADDTAAPPDDAARLSVPFTCDRTGTLTYRLELLRPDQSVGDARTGSVTIGPCGEITGRRVSGKEAIRVMRTVTPRALRDVRCESVSIATPDRRAARWRCVAAGRSCKETRTIAWTTQRKFGRTVRSRSIGAARRTCR